MLNRSYVWENSRNECITAVVGREVMEFVKRHLLAVHFDRKIGSATGLKTLKIMDKEKTWETIMK